MNLEKIHQPLPPRWTEHRQSRGIHLCFAGIAVLIALGASADLARAAGEPVLSDDTDACLDCHISATPAIYRDWLRSRHAVASVADALDLPAPERRVSLESVPEGQPNTSVGCAECHMIDPEAHADTFEHNGYDVHTIVTPSDCANCHPDEDDQYAHNIMSAAYDNLMANPLYQALMTAGIGLQWCDGLAIVTEDPDSLTSADACLYCHGTQILVEGEIERETTLGEMSFPKLVGWPNQGVGRVNPDGSLGSCAACHTRHQFSIVMARKPATCSQCHKGPDVPAYKVYSVSKHGNIYESLAGDWSFDAVPWIPGRDFTAPTCATCHVSLLANEDGEVIAPRTHRMNDRLAWRIFGLPYAHPHPKNPSTIEIRNKAGLPLPTELTGEPASEYLIDAGEMETRRANMERVCLNCHAGGWVDSHFERFEHTIQTTNRMTLSATQILSQAWEHGLAQGPQQAGNPFDEAIEKMWTEQWLFFANSTRFASAMAGADYGSFANGRWYLSKNLRLMHDWLHLRLTGD